MRRMGSGEGKRFVKQSHLMVADAPQPHKEVPEPEGRRQRLLPVGAAADYLSVSRATIERLVSRGQLPVVKIGASTRYDVEDLDGFIATNRCRDRRRSA